MRILRPLLLTLSALVLLALVAATPAAAATGEPVPTLAFTIDVAAVVQLLLAVVLPILVGLVTTRVTSSARKAWLLALLTLVTSLLTEFARALATESVFDLGVALVAVLPAFAISVASHYGLWKPTGTAEKLKDIGVTAE